MKCAVHLSLLFGMAVIANAAPMVKVGEHPTSRQTSSPPINSLHAFGGRLYLSYGNYDAYPAVVIVSYDPAANQFRLEQSVSSDAVGYFRTIDGKLYAPQADPIHYEDFRDFSYLDPGLPAPGWRDQTPVGALHVFDFAKAGTALYYVGSKEANEDSLSGGVLMKSLDNGMSWTVAIPFTSRTRYYWCFPHGGRVYVEGGYYDGTGIVPKTTFLSTSAYKPTNVGSGGGVTEYVIALRSRAVASDFSISSTDLLRFDGTSVSTLRSGVYDFAFDGAVVYLLTSGGTVLVCDNITAAAPTFTTLPITDLPVSSRALEALEGVVYVGTAAGDLWAARADGASLAVTTPTTVNLLPDAFGRGLAADANQLLVGAPDSSAAGVLAGRVQLFESPSPGSWTEAGVIDPPTPDFSGWFGKDVAMKGDMVALVEAGYDITNADRGSAARVHVYQHLSNGSWASRSILEVPFAHSVALDRNSLLVASSNPAANQAAGQPSLHPYLLTRAPNGELIVTAQAELLPAVNNWGYKPAARVAAAGDLVVAGFSGDVSRGGGKGMISVFKRNAAGTAFAAAPVQEWSTSAPDRFGFAVSFDGQWLAVGAPRNDTAARQAGAVHVYENTGGTAPFVPRQVILSPAIQPEALFGSAVAIKHGVMLIGSPGAMVDGQRHRGRVYRYLLSAGNWVADGEMPAPGSSRAEFGIEVAIGETFLAAGSRSSADSSSLRDRVALDVNPKPFTSFDLWAEGHRLAVVSPDGDGDGDGANDLIEYVFNLHPAVADANVQASSAPVAGHAAVFAGAEGAFEFRFVRPIEDPRLTVAVETSSDVVSWNLVTAVPTVMATDGKYQLCSVPLPRGVEKSFARLRLIYNR